MVCRRKLSAAITSLEDGENGSSVAQQRASLLGPSLRLKEEEDVLVDVLLEREDVPVELEPNPFDPHLVDVSELAREAARPPSGEGRASKEGEESELDRSGPVDCDGSDERPDCSPRHSVSALGAGSEGGGTVRSLEEIDARLMDLALDHTWDERCSLADLPVRSSVHAATLRQSVASALQRMGSQPCSSVMSAASARDASSSAAASSTAPPWAQRASAGRNVTQLPAIPEREAWSAGGAEAGRQSCAESSAGASSHASKRPSKHDKMDYLRPMREQRELTSLCARNLDMCFGRCSVGLGPLREPTTSARTG